MNEIYFDNSATTRSAPEAIAAALSAMTENFGNPSAAHCWGVAAAKQLQSARECIAALLAVPAGEIYFTSGGTEANNTVLRGIAASYARQRRKILISAVEHPSVIEPAKVLAGEGFDVHYIPVDSRGIIDLTALKELLDSQVSIVSCQHVNNETGAIQPLFETGKLLAAHAPEAFFHVDGVQSFGRLPVDLMRAGVHAFTASGHKIHAPKGIGFFWLKKGRRLQPLLSGGGQENNLRSGTENMPGIMALARAAELAYANMAANTQNMVAVKQELADGLLADIPDTIINGGLNENFVPHILNISFAGVKSEVLLHALEAEGIACSSGSACAANKSDRSHVLTAMGLTDSAIDSAIRFSFCAQNTVEEAKICVEKTAKTVAELRKLITRK
jgi:cysteine desulfurase